ncbi:hypothetical protein O181_072782 [Austropuccinia psidii MF-1]|uniref:Uncharacterized protein n=1 Tax=Austropuccinia psidii MF-1 TaxID=1389203 RepID=A0A9Q3IAF7_9BASI|nr:hypothetical protein [Austropuccinia psidii MF-1]
MFDQSMSHDTSIGCLGPITRSLGGEGGACSSLRLEELATSTVSSVDGSSIEASETRASSTASQDSEEGDWASSTNSASLSMLKGKTKGESTD